MPSPSHPPRYPLVNRLLSLLLAVFFGSGLCWPPSVSVGLAKDLPQWQQWLLGSTERREELKEGSKVDDDRENSSSPWTVGGET